MNNLAAVLSNDKKKLILAGLGVLILLYLDFSLVLRSQINAIRRDSVAAVKLRQDIDNLGSELARYQAIKAASGPLRVKEPIREEELPVLLQRISELANEKNIRIMQIQPLSLPQAKETQGQSQLPGLKPILVDIDLLCGYHSLGGFLSDMGDLSVPLSVERLNIQPSSVNPMQQNTQLVLRTYVKK